MVNGDAGKGSVERARQVAGDHVPAAGASIAYESPEAVLADDTLAPDQKRRFLTGWRQALADHLAGREVADADVGGEADLLARIDRALETLAGA